MMWKHLLLACLIQLCVSHEPDIDIINERMSNGDESEMVTIDFKPHDGIDDVKMSALLRIHLEKGQVHVNGQPIIHNVVNSIHMYVSIVETEYDVKSDRRFAPALFRILALQDDISKKLTTEIEFVQIDDYDVEQVDVKQIIWEGSNRLPMTSVSTQQSLIRHTSPDADKHVFFEHHQKEHGKHGKHGHHGKHGRHGKHGKHPCWFHKLSRRAKIVVIVSAALCLLVLLVLTIVCWRRRRMNRMNVVVEAPVTVAIETEKNVEKDFPTKEGEFHMEINEGYVGDKVDLID